MRLIIIFVLILTTGNLFESKNCQARPATRILIVANTKMNNHAACS